MASLPLPKEVMLGREVGMIEVYAVHAGANKADVAKMAAAEMPELQNPYAQQNLVNYRDGMVAAHGDEVDWVHAPFDAQVMYDSTGGKPKGRYAIGDGAFNSSDVKHSTGKKKTPAMSSTSRGRECELERRVEEQERQLADQARQFAERERSMQSAISSLTQWVQSQNPNGPPPPIFSWGHDPFSTPLATTSPRQATQDSADGVIHGLSQNSFGRTSDRSNHEAGRLRGSGEGSGGVDDWLNSPGSRN